MQNMANIQHNLVLFHLGIRSLDASEESHAAASIPLIAWRSWALFDHKRDSMLNLETEDVS